MTIPTSVRNRPRRGAVLVEFAIVAFLLYLILGAVLTFGRALFVAQSLQQTTDTFSHQLARTPLPPNDALADAIADPAVRQTLFNEDALEIDITAWMQNDQGMTLNQFLQQQKVPLVNRMLAPLMIIDDRADGHTVLRYPGAMKDVNGHYYVNIVKGDGTSAPIQVPVIEAVGNPDPFRLGTAPSPGSLATPTGLAGVRINYPFQSAALGTIAQDGSTGIYPFRRLISAQAVYRREVFAAEQTTP